MAHFTMLDDAMKITVPEGRDMIEMWSKVSPGFGIRRLADRKGKPGRRLYIVRYDGEKRNQKKPLPVLFDGSETSFKAARKQAEAIRAVALNNKKKEGARTLTQAWEDYAAIRPLSVDTLTTYQKGLERVPADQRLLLMDKITPDDVQTLYLELVKKHGRTSALMTMRVLNMLYRREIAKKRITDNPLTVLAADTKLYARDKRGTDEEEEDKYIAPEDLPAVWWAMELLHPSVRDYLRILLFTSWRKSIAGSLEWSHVDKVNRIYHITEGARGNKAKIAVSYPIADALWQLVFEPRLAGKQSGRWVLPSDGRAGQPLHYPSGAFAFLESKTGLHLHPHKFRYTCATIADAALDFNLVLVGRILMHTPNLTRQEAMTNKYVGKRADPFRAGVNKLAAAILEHVGISLPPLGADQPPVVATPSALPVVPVQALTDYPDLRLAGEGAAA